MIPWLLALAGAVVGAWIAYGPLALARAQERSGLALPVANRAARVGLGALRGAAYLLLLAILLGAPAGRPSPLAPLAVLDVSASWQRANDGSAWRAALDSVRSLGGDSVILAGDSARIGSLDQAKAVGPTDPNSRLQPALDLAAALGRAVVLVTDGEPADPTAFTRLGRGSRAVVLERAPAIDLAVADVEAPSIATGGDTIDVHATLVAGASAVRAGSLDVLLDGSSAARVALAPFEPFDARRVSVRVPLPRGARGLILSLAASAPDDVEGRNDTLSAALDVTDRPRAVFVSTAPDLDVREALRLLRGAVAVPTRGYLRVAPNVWREEGTLAPITQAEVERRAREAGMLVLHGDTAWAGVAGVRRGALVLWTPAPPPAPPRAGEIARPVEWFLQRAPASPLSASLDALPFDSLPPLALGEPVSDGVPVLEARMGRAGAARAIASVGDGQGARTVRVSGTGFAAWVQRGGRSADAFAALWGAIFDWAVASEGAGSGVRLDTDPIRAGEPLQWRRGGPDSLVTLTLTGSDGRVDSLALRFVGGSDRTDSPALDEGLYTVREGDASFRLVVNPSREWVPQAPLAAPAVEAAGAPSAPARPLRESNWPFVAALLLLCAEWLLRRRAGLR